MENKEDELYLLALDGDRQTTEVKAWPGQRKLAALLVASSLPLTQDNDDGEAAQPQGLVRHIVFLAILTESRITSSSWIAFLTCHTSQRNCFNYYLLVLNMCMAHRVQHFLIQKIIKV